MVFIRKLLSRKFYNNFVNTGRSPDLRFNTNLPIIAKDSGIEEALNIYHLIGILSLQLREQFRILTGFPFNFNSKKELKTKFWTKVALFI